jgi:hypothetical protein
VWLFGTPPAGSHGTLVSDPVLDSTTESGPVPVAVSDGVLFVGGTDQIAAYAVSGELDHPAGPPFIARAAARGFATGTPTLQMTVRRAPYAAPIASVTIQLPRGVSIRGSRTQLLRAIAVGKPAKLAGVSAHAGALRAVLTQAQAMIPITIHSTILRESHALRIRVQARRHGLHRYRLTWTVRPIDTLGTTTTLPVRVRIG